MNVQTQIRAAEPVTTEHFDVLIAGAGISGVGAAYHLTTQSPGTSFVVLETQKTFGGTWSTHRYPGIRSDSDLHTFGYRFKPWRGAPIATGEESVSVAKLVFLVGIVGAVIGLKLLPFARRP